MAVATSESASARLPVIKTYIAWGDPVTDPSSALGDLIFDAILTEEHHGGSAVTDHPVEQGVNIVDHVRPLPYRVSLEVFVSNAPIASRDSILLPLTMDLPQPGQGGFLVGGTSALLSQAAVALGLIKGFPLTQTVLVQQFAGDVDYVSQAWLNLNALRTNATLLQVVTPRVSLTNMILEDVKMHRDAGTGTSARFSLDFRQIRVVSSSIVDAPQPSIPRADQPSSLGKKDPKPASGPKSSVAFTGANAAGANLPETAGLLPQS